MNETLSLRTLADLRGCLVISADRTEVGQLIEILYDSVSEDPVWLGVAPSRGLRFDTLLVPAIGAFEEAGAVRVPFVYNKIRNQPPTDHGEGFASRTDEQRLYNYFALPQSEKSDLRVLHERDDPPWSESTF